MSLDLLFEIGTEELPASFLTPALKALRAGVADGLSKVGLPIGEGDGAVSLDTFATPRRLTLIARGIPSTTPQVSSTVTGPPAARAFDKEGKLTKAALGFARGKGLDPSELTTVSTPKGDYLGARITQGGEAVSPILTAILRDVTLNLPFRKSMRWTETDARFGRPLRWLVALLGDQVLPVDVSGIKAGRTTQGLRFYGERSFEVSSPEDYITKLEAGGIVPRAEDRQGIIREGLVEQARVIGGFPEIDEDLLADVANLVEHPRVIVGSFDSIYLEMPPEVPVTVMKHHQRYFPVRDEKGALMNAFLQVINSPTADAAKVVVGNQRVLSARLSDGRFFWEEDLKHSLDDQAKKLGGIVFHARLGTLAEKVARVQALTQSIAKGAGFGGDVPAQASRAAALAKADLVTWMVGEFPELQGRMGMEYARRGGEPEAVATAIVEHYLPKEAGGALPQSDVGAIVALADKLDSIVAFHAIGKGPTGAADPYALRRAGLGVLRILMDKGWDLSLRDAVQGASALIDAQVYSRAKTNQGAVVESVMSFFEGRLRGLLVSEGIPKDQVEAVLSAGMDPVADAASRARALAKMAQSEDFRALMIAFKRAVNISKDQPDGGASAIKRLDGYGATLADAVAKVEAKLKAQISERSYDDALQLLLELKGPIDAFFDNEMVMAEDLAVREARLSILHRIAGLFQNIADFSKLSS